jgi:hypothetical protein
MAATNIRGTQQPHEQILNTQEELKKVRPSTGFPLRDILEVPNVFEFVREHNGSCGHGFDWQEMEQTVKVRCCRCKKEFEERRKPLHDPKRRLANDGTRC